MDIVEAEELRILERLNERVLAAEKTFDQLDFLSEKSLRQIVEEVG